jgi:hypothetical protein
MTPIGFKSKLLPFGGFLGHFDLVDLNTVSGFLFPKYYYFTMQRNKHFFILSPHSIPNYRNVQVYSMTWWIILSYEVPLWPRIAILFAVPERKVLEFTVVLKMDNNSKIGSIEWYLLFKTIFGDVNRKRHWHQWKINLAWPSPFNKKRTWKSSETIT